MKFKDWFLTLTEGIIEDSVFKCIGYCPKWFFYVDKDCSTEKLINDIKNDWGPANYEIVHFDDIYVNSEDHKLWFVLVCNDGKDGLTNEQIKEIEQKEIEQLKRMLKQ